MTEITPPGIYLVNSTGEMDALATEADGIVDQDLLTEVLYEHGYLDPVEEANDHLAAALKHANRYTSHDEVRPSAVSGFGRVETASQELLQVDPTRSLPDGDDE